MYYNTLLNDNAILSENISYEINDGTVRINKGTVMAAKAIKYRDIYRVSKKNKSFLESLLNEYKAYSGCSRIGSAVRANMSAVLANMVFSDSINKSVLYSRKNAKTSKNKSIKGIIDFMTTKGYLLNVIGRANEYQENGSWFHVTDRFSLDAARENIKVIIINDGNFLVLRDEDGNDIKIKENRQTALKIRKLSSSVNLYNTLWLDNDATLDGKHLIPFNFRIFNKSLDLGGRFYRGSYQGLPKEDRSRILINNEPTCEPDYSSLHYNLLYAKEGIQLDYDPYLIDGYERKTIKIASFVLLNCDSLTRFKSNVTKSGNPKVKSAFQRWKKEYKGDYKQDDNRPDYLKGFIEGMPDNIKGNELLKALQDKHYKIAHWFGTEDIGLKLQKMDSDIMANVLTTLSGLNIPVLPVHDSLICPKSKLNHAKLTMQQCYNNYTGYNIQI